MHNTLVAFEQAVFRKLTVAYVLNTVLQPLAVGLLPVGITPAWYEEGGITTQSVTLIVAAGTGFSAFQVLQPMVYLKRHALARAALSQPQLDRLWRAPPLQFAATYASTAKSLALCLVYAPIWPPAYALTAVLLLFSYACFRLAIRKWYARPPPLDEALLDEMRAALLVLLIVHVCVQHVVSAYARDAALSSGLARFVVLISLCSLGFFFSIRPRESATTTDGVPYDKVYARVATPIETYENPAAKVARRLRGLERSVCGAMDQSRQRQAAQKQNISVASSASGARRSTVKLRVCRKEAHHSSASSGMRMGTAAHAVPAGGGSQRSAELAAASRNPSALAAQEHQRAKSGISDQGVRTRVCADP